MALNVAALCVLFAFACAACTYVSGLFPPFSRTVSARQHIDENVVDLSNIYSRSAVLMDAETGRILAEKNGGGRIYPASLTKIMTAVLTIENTADLNEKIIMPQDIFPQLYDMDASMAGFLPGEEAKMRDMVYGMILPSGAECCLAAAIEISGSEDEFVKLMNKKAKEIGMENTHFCNCTGLHNMRHYTTAEDIAVLLKYALKNDIFRDIFTSKRYSVPPTAKHKDGFTMRSALFSKLGSAEVPGGEILGGKTGYTAKAGLCLASLAAVNGREYILVTAGAKGDHSTEQYNILDAVDIYGRVGETAPEST